MKSFTNRSYIPDLITGCCCTEHIDSCTATLTDLSFVILHNRPSQHSTLKTEQDTHTTSSSEILQVSCCCLLSLPPLTAPPPPAQKQHRRESPDCPSHSQGLGCQHISGAATVNIKRSSSSSKAQQVSWVANKLHRPVAGRAGNLQAKLLLQSAALSMSAASWAADRELLPYRLAKKQCMLQG